MSDHDDLDVRLITEDEIPDWLRAVAVGFLRSETITEEEIAARA